MKKCKWCGRKIWPWQTKTRKMAKRADYYHSICFLFERTDILAHMIVEAKTDLPPSTEEIKQTEDAIGWSKEAYIFYRLELEMNHEKARNGAFTMNWEDSKKLRDKLKKKVLK